jgi:serralysin
VISGFNLVDDTIQLSAAILGGLTSGFALTAAEFAANAADQASNLSQRVIYETDNGNLWFDADGTGLTARIQFADPVSSLGLTAADFLVSV